MLLLYIIDTVYVCSYCSMLLCVTRFTIVYWLVKTCLQLMCVLCMIV